MNSKNTSASNKADDNGFRNDPSTSKKMLPTNEPTADRELSKKRHITPESDLNGVKFPKQEKAANLRNDEGKAVLSIHQCQQAVLMQSTTSCATNETSDDDAVDPSQNNCMMPQNNMYGTMNQWSAPVNSATPGIGVASSNASENSGPDCVLEVELRDEEDETPAENLEKVKLQEEKAKLQEENELLHCLIRAAHNDVALIKAEEDKKEAALRNACERMHEQLILMKRKLKETKEDILNKKCQENVSRKGE